MWRLCLPYFLLLCPGTGGRALCDNGRFNIRIDLPEETAYICQGGLWPFPSKVLPSISTRYKQEDSLHTCIDTQIVYTSLIPNSGVHRPKAAKYGEYIYCPPQRWLHNLKHGGVAFLYHPCVHPLLKGALSQMARSCMYKHIITPLTSLSIERPIALAAWGSSLEMSQVDLKAVKGWLQVNIYRDHENETENEDLYDHLLIQPSMMVSDQKDTVVCPRRPFQISEIFQKRLWLKKTLRKRQAASAVYSFTLRATTVAFHHGETPLQNVATEAQVVANLKVHSEDPSVLKRDITNTPTPVLSVQKPANLISPDGDTGNSSHVSAINKHEEDVVPETEIQRNITIAGYNAKDSSNNRLGSFSEHLKNTSKKEGNLKENLLPSKNQEPDLKDMEYRNDMTRKTQDLISDNLAQKQSNNPLEPLPTSGLDLSRNDRQECKCQQETTTDLPPKAQMRSSAGHRRKLDVYASTQRTEEATWAAASLMFLFVLLAVCVLYTQIHKKFRKSHSLYWRSGRTCLETESVASVIKRRLKQAHSKRKKWIGRKKPPVLLYDSLSDSSD